MPCWRKDSVDAHPLRFKSSQGFCSSCSTTCCCQTYIPVKTRTKNYDGKLHQTKCFVQSRSTVSSYKQVRLRMFVSLRPNKMSLIVRGFCQFFRDRCFRCNTDIMDTHSAGWDGQPRIPKAGCNCARHRRGSQASRMFTHLPKQSNDTAPKEKSDDQLLNSFINTGF